MTRILSLLILLVLLSPSAYATGACPDWPTIFQRNRRENRVSHGTKILVGSFQNNGLEDDDWLSEAFYFVLSDYFDVFDHFKAMRTRPDRRFEAGDTVDALKAGKMMGADYVLYGLFKRDTSKPVLKVFVRFVDVKKGGEIDRLSWEIEFPKNDSLFNLFFQIADDGYKRFSGGKNGTKILAPYKHESRSVEALRHYAIGRSFLEAGDLNDIDKAIEELKAAVQNDYNYVPAYVAEAEALLMKNFSNRIMGKPNRKSVEEASLSLTRAGLLHPAYVNQYGATARRYLEADTHEIMGLNLMQQNPRKARAEFKKALSLLPGDVDSMKKLGLKEQLKELDRCQSQ